MAEYVLVPCARLLVPLGDLDPSKPRRSATLRSRRTTRSRGHAPALVPGTTAVVIGVGGLGHMAIQILRALHAARVVAIDTSPAKLELARELGADEAWHGDR